MIAANSAGIDNTELYRIPWTLPDNGISWLEPTILCNLKCDGCYRKIESDPHKPWQRVMEELDVFQSKRKSDCISIAGGDPLLYPKIVELVREVRRRGAMPDMSGGLRYAPRRGMWDVGCETWDVPFGLNVGRLTFYVWSRATRSTLGAKRHRNFRHFSHFSHFSHYQRVLKQCMNKYKN